MRNYFCISHFSFLIPNLFCLCAVRQEKKILKSVQVQMNYNAAQQFL